MEFKENRYDGEEQVQATLAEKQKYTDDISNETFRKKVEARLFTQQSMLWSEICRRAATNTGWQWHRADALDGLKSACVHKDSWREEGSYVNKGPFPKPATMVRIKELSRDDDTGKVKLRLSPVNADRLFAEFGGPATPASMALEGRDFETEELRVSFLAVDASGEHETGEPFPWQNRITLKAQDYAHGNERMVEIRSAPTAPIRYTTDGSDPKVNGGTYDGPFAAPDGTQIVLAIAEKDGITSEQLKRVIAEKPETKPIDPAQPAVWHPSPDGFSFQETRTTYGFINRLKKHQASAGGVRVGAQADNTWAELMLSDDVELDAERMEQAIEQLRALVPEGAISIDAKHVKYETGQRFLDYVEEIKVDYNREDVEP